MSQEADTERSSAPEGRPAESPRGEAPIGCLARSGLGGLIGGLVPWFLMYIALKFGHYWPFPSPTSVAGTCVVLAIVMLLCVVVVILAVRSK